MRYAAVPLLVLTLGAVLLVVQGAPEAAWLLLVGWIAFLARVLPGVTAEPTTIATGLTALVLFTALLHLIARRSYASARPGLPSRWPWRWTIAGVAVVVLLFAGGLSAVALLRGTAWLGDMVTSGPEPLGGGVR
jgi:hypothetical protein